jgi:quercetin dioxygenase-like cupin family protein
MKTIRNLAFVSALARIGHGRGTPLRVVAFVSALVVALTALVDRARATPPANVSGMVVARASFVDRTDVRFKIKEHHGRTHVIQAPDALDTVIQQIIIGPGGTTGWHTHPGPAVVLIAAGELTLYSGDDLSCTPHTYWAGEAFIDPGQGHVHHARNLSATDTVEVWVTYFDVPPGEPFRLDAPDPGNCNF